MHDKVQVFAVVRVDKASDGIYSAPHEFITVKEIVPTHAEAEAEVERLNALSGGRNYFWQATRYFPRGRPASTLEDDQVE